MPKDELPKGLYDLLTTEWSYQQLENTPYQAHREPLGNEQSHRQLADTLADRMSQLLALLPGDEQNSRIHQQARLINDLLIFVRSRLNELGKEVEVDLLREPPDRLLALTDPNLQPKLPEIGLSQPWLFTAGKDSPALLHELTAELSNCNQVDILVSFITVSGVRKIIDVLRRLTATDAQGDQLAKIRVLTTTYVGATEQKALDMLAELPNCEVRISLDGRRTRLHAKAWIFGRDSGFGSAYVGSANLSGAALMGGLEWTVKFTETGQTTLYNRAKAHFETLWEDNEFQTYDHNNIEHQRVLRSALQRESGKSNPIANPTFFELQPKAFQEDILEQLEAERLHGRYRNLLVAATGTGKTVMAAFDYRALARKEGGHPRLLFVAHRIEILQQAIATYRQVLRAPNFGSLLSGHHEADEYQHLFATIQSVHSKGLLKHLGPDYWRVVVVDECHHIEAQQFERFVSAIQPEILLGLTATPERRDGRDILRHFENRPDGTPAVQLRLWHALDLQLLVSCTVNIDM
ncbi:MAG: DEAD/DEAH box helicase family protein [Natronospirillum sp.]|uniref:DEAD/DEAH box helicase family protein n=1 Tax=Natronospirillum sp. TaxID=2812955 RepID=UPI0025D0BD70|nr:DEAD/DEAH box helicase family protein [Natronospirillum sp.]MCH8552909.1 DEAD/DEAH box helicase family protein [Natronospirillum sp.]